MGLFDEAVVSEEIKRLPLPQPGHWIEVKTELSYYEDLKVRGAALKGSPVNPATGSISLGEDFLIGNLAKMSTYIVGWSLKSGGKRLECNEDSMRNLAPKVAEAVIAVLDQHLADLANTDGGEAPLEGTARLVDSPSAPDESALNSLSVVG